VSFLFFTINSSKALPPRPWLLVVMGIIIAALRNKPCLVKNYDLPEDHMRTPLAKAVHSMDMPVR